MRGNQETAPRDFPAVFVQHGWRGIERFFGARTAVNKRWLEECDRERLAALRIRYRRGDHSVLSEVMT